MGNIPCGNFINTNKKMGSLVDYFPGNNFYSYCVKKIRKREKKQVIYYVIIGDKVFMFHVKHCFPQSKKNVHY